MSRTIRFSRQIEPKIRPLVDALNETGLFETFSSCEGHFGVREPDSITNREKAEVRFYDVEGVQEKAIEDFCGKVLADYATVGGKVVGAPRRSQEVCSRRRASGTDRLPLRLRDSALQQL